MTWDNPGADQDPLARSRKFNNLVTIFTTQAARYRSRGAAGVTGS
ncbi:hypothetical protein [Acidocella sp.]